MPSAATPCSATLGSRLHETLDIHASSPAHFRYIDRYPRSGACTRTGVNSPLGGGIDIPPTLATWHNGYSSIWRRSVRRVGGAIPTGLGGGHLPLVGHLVRSRYLFISPSHTNAPQQQETRSIDVAAWMCVQSCIRHRQGVLVEPCRPSASQAESAHGAPIGTSGSLGAGRVTGVSP